VDKLWEQGIIGKGVNIAMIGEPILTDHVELADNLVDYEELGTIAKTADPHSTAVASLLVGKTVGIAPDAKLYYFAASMAKTKEDLAVQNIDYSEYQKAFDRIFEINQQLSAKDQIRLVVVDGYFDQYPPKGQGEYIASKDYQGMMASKAKLEAFYDVLVMDYVNEGGGGVSGLSTISLSRAPLEDPDDLSKYYLSTSAQKLLPYDPYSPAKGNFQFYTITVQCIAVPGEQRTLASAYGDRVYTHYSAAPCVYSDVNGIQSEFSDGFSSAFVAGLYALCLQTGDNVTPERLYSLLPPYKTTLVSLAWVPINFMSGSWMNVDSWGDLNMDQDQLNANAAQTANCQVLIPSKMLSQLAPQ